VLAAPPEAVCPAAIHEPAPTTAAATAASLLAMAPNPHTQLAALTDELSARAAFQRPDLAPAFSDDGWIAIRVPDIVLVSAGLAFGAGDVALARPAVARHPSDFIAYSERLGGLVGLRHGDHFRFADELGEAA
jgi:hypothetical protein